MVHWLSLPTVNDPAKCTWRLQGQPLAHSHRSKVIVSGRKYATVCYSNVTVNNYAILTVGAIYRQVVNVHYMVLIAYLQLLAKNPHIGARLLSYHTGSPSNWHALLVAFEVEDEPGKLKVIHCQRHSSTSKGTVNLAEELGLVTCRLH